MVALRLAHYFQRPHRYNLVGFADALWWLVQGLLRPKTRADCVDGPRPCVWASCPHHLLGDITSCGSYRVRANHALIPWKSRTSNPRHRADERMLSQMADVIGTLPHSCVLDVAAEVDGEPDELPTKEIARLLRLSAWRTRQAERSGRATIGDDLTSKKPKRDHSNEKGPHGSKAARRADRSTDNVGDFTGALNALIAERRLKKLEDK